MQVAAFVLLAAMLTAYVLLDGYDLGVGAIHLFAARAEDERAASLASIGPFWSGNEVMLIAAGASLFALFPKAYAAAFSGFYLPFIIVLWLLMVRGMSIELRGHFPSDLWRGFWDVAFSVSSALLALIFGIALGNIIRGVPLDASGYFAGTFDFLLNPYGIGAGLLAVAVLSMHGAAFLWMRSQGDLAMRARRIMRAQQIAAIVLFVAVTVATFFVTRVPQNPILWIAPIVSLLSIAAVRFAKDANRALFASSLALLALMASAALTIFPSLLPGFPNAAAGLTIYNTAPGAYSLGTAFTAGTIGFVAALMYGTLAARRMLARR